MGFFCFFFGETVYSHEWEYDLLGIAHWIKTLTLVLHSTCVLLYLSPDKLFYTQPDALWTYQKSF